MPRFGFVISSLLLFFGTSPLQAQGLRVYPLAARWAEPALSNSTLAWGITDTLSLPFFEDFAEPGHRPNAKRWTDRQAWINQGFAQNLPNIQAATLDHLNEWGQPYHFLDPNSRVWADTLCSQPINLQYYASGSSTVNYKPADSLYLSFFVERGGLGDLPESSDSLVLSFKTNNGEWIPVWRMAGGAYLSREVFIPISEYRFLGPTFQFRFNNFTKATGNLNHWNLDYIRLNKNRSIKEASLEDIGIFHFKPGLFHDYYNIPFDHYAGNRIQAKGEGSELVIRNSGVNASDVRTSLKISNQYGQVIYDKPFSSSSLSIDGLSNIQQKIELGPFDTLSGTAPELHFDVRINPAKHDSTAIRYQATTSNNRWEYVHKVQPWYAYDDGSAEGGFGLDYAHLGNIKGQFAMEFTTYQDDSLRGLAIQFNQSKTDVSTKGFRLRIWKAISPLSGPDNQDQLIYEWFMDAPIYRDSVNEFTYVFFDSVLYLPKGQYYAGWLQSIPYVLNVGYDNNYRFSQDPNQANPHLFYNLLGSWERADYSVKGTPMIRLLMGGRESYLFHTQQASIFEISAYPNPTTDYLNIQGIAESEIEECLVVDANGRQVPVWRNGHQLDIHHLSNGRYTLVLRTRQGQRAYWHFVKLNP